MGIFMGELLVSGRVYHDSEDWSSLQYLKFGAPKEKDPKYLEETQDSFWI